MSRDKNLLEKLWKTFFRKILVVCTQLTINVPSSLASTWKCINCRISSISCQYSFLLGHKQAPCRARSKSSRALFHSILGPFGKFFLSLAVQKKTTVLWKQFANVFGPQCAAHANICPNLIFLGVNGCFWKSIKKLWALEDKRKNNPGSSRMWCMCNLSQICQERAMYWQYKGCTRAQSKSMSIKHHHQHQQSRPMYYKVALVQQSLISSSLPHQHQQRSTCGTP